MKLEGSLDAFSLADVLTLLNATSKSGALSLAHEGRSAVIHLIDGTIAAAAGESLSGLGVLRRLVAQGIVDEDAVSDAAVAAAESGDGLVTWLVAADRLDREIACEVSRSLALDTVFDLLRWEDGAFSFAADERPQDDVGLRAAPDELVAEATSRTETWIAAMDAVPSPHAVPVACAVAGDLSLDADEWNLLVLVDGARTVEELVQLGGQGTFTVVTRLMALADRDLIDFIDAGDVGPWQARLNVLRMLDAAAGQVQEGDDEVALDEPSPAAGEVDEAPPAPVEAPPVSGGGTVVTVEDPRPTQSAVPTPVPAAPSSAGDVTRGSQRVEAERVEAQHGQHLLGGAHTPGDVVPPRPEPFLPNRRPDHDDLRGRGSESTLGFVGANALAADVMPEDEPADEADDVLINRSMVLRLIAGVRGL